MERFVLHCRDVSGEGMAVMECQQRRARAIPGAIEPAAGREQHISIPKRTVDDQGQLFRQRLTIDR